MSRGARIPPQDAREVRKAAKAYIRAVRRIVPKSLPADITDEHRREAIFHMLVRMPIDELLAQEMPAAADASALFWIAVSGIATGVGAALRVDLVDSDEARDEAIRVITAALTIGDPQAMAHDGRRFDA